MKYLSLYRIIFVLMILVLLYNLGSGFVDYFMGKYSYKDDIISEWLINYEGGFVRRGLTGQILFFFYQLTPFPVADVIVCLFFLGVCLLTVLLVWMFVTKGWSLFILPFPLCLYSFLGYRFLISRRDAWMLLLASLFFMLYKKYIQKNSFTLLALMNLLFVLGMLIYESIIFFIFPIVFSHFLYKIIQKKGLIKGGLCAMIMWLPSLFMPFLIFRFAGTSETTTLMVQSWSDLFYRYPMCEPFNTEDVYIFDWIGQPLLEHIKGVFYVGWSSYAIGIIPRFIFNLYSFVAIYYLITRMNVINMNYYRLHSYDSTQLSNIVIIQFAFLIPYMLFLSCDMARNITYWTISSFMFFFFFDKSSFSPRKLSEISEKIQTQIQRYHVLNTPFTYLAILLTLPLEFHGGGVKMLIPIIPQELKHIVRLLL